MKEKHQERREASGTKSNGREASGTKRGVRNEKQWKRSIRNEKQRKRRDRKQKKKKRKKKKKKNKNNKIYLEFNELYLELFQEKSFQVVLKERHLFCYNRRIATGWKKRLSDKQINKYVHASHVEV